MSTTSLANPIVYHCNQSALDNVSTVSAIRSPAGLVCMLVVQVTTIGYFYCMPKPSDRIFIRLTDIEVIVSRARRALGRCNGRRRDIPRPSHTAQELPHSDRNKAWLDALRPSPLRQCVWPCPGPTCMLEYPASPRPPRRRAATHATTETAYAGHGAGWAGRWAGGRDRAAAWLESVITCLYTPASVLVRTPGLRAAFICRRPLPPNCRRIISVKVTQSFSPFFVAFT